jgi:hypothetical protein
VELTMTGEPDGLTAVLLQLAGLTQKLAELDQRQAGDTHQLQERATALAAAVNDLKGTTASHAEALAALDRLDAQVTGLAAQIAGPPGGDSDDGPAGYRPSPQPRFWKLDGQARDEATGKLRAWVEQVYRPGYGHLAASLGDCWEQHPLCLYILDWLSELWSVLYLAPARTPGTLAGQAEWHIRLLVAAAEHLSRETRGCTHGARSRTALPGERP